MTVQYHCEDSCGKLIDYIMIMHQEKIGLWPSANVITAQ